MTNFLNSSENRYDDFIREALRHLDNRSISEMSDICGNAVKLVKDRCEAYFLLSIAAFLLDDLGRALELAQKGHEIDPDCQEGNDILAHLLAHAGHIEESVFHAKLVSVGSVESLLAEQACMLRSVVLLCRPLPTKLVEMVLIGLSQFPANRQVWQIVL